MKTRHFTDEVYGTEFVLVSDGTPEQFARFMWQHYDAGYEQDDELRGQCLALTGTTAHTVIIYIRDWRRNYSPACISTLTHEVFHAVEETMNYHGVPHGDGISEAWAYYLDFVLRRCLEILR